MIEKRKTTSTYVFSTKTGKEEIIEIYLIINYFSNNFTLQNKGNRREFIFENSHNFPRCHAAVALMSEAITFAEQKIIAHKKFLEK